MAKPELGTKRLCGGCGAKFYDLNKDPILCPKCGAAFEPLATVARGRPGLAAAAPAADEEAVPEAAEAAEFVSLEEADAETQGAKPPAADVETDDDVEVDDESLDDAAFLETDEDEDEDVSDIIGEGIEPDEET